MDTAQQHPTPDVAVIVAGGDPIDPDVLQRIPQPSTVIAADSGLDEIRALGLSADVVVGDLDSVSAAAMADAIAGGVTVHRHPVDKDATDLELALDLVRRQGYVRAVLIGGKGGRLSHLLGNALVLASPATASLRVEWHIGGATVYVVRRGQPAEITGQVGDVVSLIAAGGPATGVTTHGLRWALNDATLASGSTRGISNEMTEMIARVAAANGAILTIHERT